MTGGRRRVIDRGPHPLRNMEVPPESPILDDPPVTLPSNDRTVPDPEQATDSRTNLNSSGSDAPSVPLSPGEDMARLNRCVASRLALLEVYFGVVAAGSTAEFSLARLRCLARHLMDWSEDLVFLMQDFDPNPIESMRTLAELYPHAFDSPSGALSSRGGQRTAGSDQLVAGLGNTSTSDYQENAPAEMPMATSLQAPPIIPRSQPAGRGHVEIPQQSQDQDDAAASSKGLDHQLQDNDKEKIPQ